MPMLIQVLAMLIAAPLIGGLAIGLDRRITARLQSRLGPPLLQPFYDVAKLLCKDGMIINLWQVFCAYVFTASAAVSLVLFFLQADLLLVLFVHAVSSVFLVMGALSANSPYSQIGAHRELIQILTYEPFLLFIAVGIYLQTGTFKLEALFQLDRPLLFKLPLLFVVLGCAICIVLRKSPFDFAGSHHAHQEIVRGVSTEYSGPYLGIIEIGHWYEMVLLLGFCCLFWATDWAGMTILVSAMYLGQILMDNIAARLTWRWMLGYLWTGAMALSILNLVWLYVG